MVDLRPLWHSRPLRVLVCLLLVLASRSGSPLTTWAEGPGDVRPPEATLLNFLVGDQWSLEGDKKDVGFAPEQVLPAFSNIQLYQALRVSNGGRDIVVAVVDTGINPSHPFLAGRLVEGRSFILGQPTLDIRDVPDGRSNAQVGHGTFIAGLILQIAPNARIMPIRVLNGDGLGTERQVADGIHYAVDHGAHVINLSLGTTREARLVRDAVLYAQQHNVVVVASIGSHSREEMTAPARFPDVLSVAATDNNDRKTVFSNYHASTAVSAPGMRLYSTYWNGRWAWGSGTSFSTALVSGAAALVRGMHPTWDAQHVRETIRTTSAPIDVLNPAYQFMLGAGRIDLYRAVTDR